jgi:hypothetical protein
MLARETQTSHIIGLNGLLAIQSAAMPNKSNQLLEILQNFFCLVANQHFIKGKHSTSRVVAK